MFRTPWVRIIIYLNIAIYLAWWFGASDEAALISMANNFLVSWDALLEGRWWTVVTSTFSHNLFWHLFFNMYVLNSFGPVLESVLGGRRFIFFYLGAGVFSSLTHALVSAYLLGNPAQAALGASGAISGLILLFALIFPRQLMLLFGVIPVPARLGAFLFVALDIWGLISQAEGGGLPIGHGAHLGGALCGLVYYFWLKRTARPQRVVSL